MPPKKQQSKYQKPARKAPSLRVNKRIPKPQPPPKVPVQQARPVQYQPSSEPQALQIGHILPKSRPTFRQQLDSYHTAIIQNYVSRGKSAKVADSEMKTRSELLGVEDWIQPGYFCSDFKTVVEDGRRKTVSTRWFVEVPRNVEVVHEIVEEHGVVCIHAALPSLAFQADIVADLWLVSIQHPGTGQTIWPPTWIYHDDFDALVKHATSAESENWRNIHPWQLNIIPEEVARAPPLIKVTSATLATVNVPFKYFLQCQIRLENRSYCNLQLSPPDLSELLTSIYIQMRMMQPGLHSVRWRSEILMSAYLLEIPILFKHQNPEFWFRQFVENTTAPPLNKYGILPDMLIDRDDESVNQSRATEYRNVVYSNDFDIDDLEAEDNGLYRSYHHGPQQIL